MAELRKAHTECHVLVEAEKAQREAERAEQRKQLQAIQEELKRVRASKAAVETAK